VSDKKKVGRNDPCPCGSGQKYKFCCLPEETFRQMIEASKKNAPAPPVLGVHVSDSTDTEDQPGG